MCIVTTKKHCKSVQLRLYTVHCVQKKRPKYFCNDFNKTHFIGLYIYIVFDADFDNIDGQLSIEKLEINFF